MCVGEGELYEYTFHGKRKTIYDREKRSSTARTPIDGTATSIIWYVDFLLLRPQGIHTLRPGPTLWYDLPGGRWKGVYHDSAHQNVGDLGKRSREIESLKSSAFPPPSHLISCCVRGPPRVVPCGRHTAHYVGAWNPEGNLESTLRGTL